MICIQKKNRAESVECPYLPGREFTQEYFLAIEVDETEFSALLEKGWRKFGYYFFRPVCRECRECIPIRILTKQFSHTKSMKRVFKKNVNLDVIIGRGEFTEERYQIFKKHSEERFNTTINRESFKDDFCISAVPTVFMDYKYEGKLIGVGVVDISSDALSSVYFAFDPDYSYYSPGIFSMLIEIETAKKLDKKYYYPGYYIDGNSSMSYKGKFRPHEYLDWESLTWKEEAE
jgi:arginine-tRNA-protein transferase